jgi:hypothetical protein
MRFFKRLLIKTFWYDIALNFTIWKTLNNSKEFNREKIKFIRKRYYDLKRINKSFIIDIQSEYHISWCSIILAIYEMCIKSGFSQEQALDITENMVFTNMNPESVANHINKALDKTNDPFFFMVKSSKNQEKYFFGSTFRFYQSIENSNSYHLRVSNCLYYNYFKKNKAPELMRIACKWDMISWSKGIIPEKHGIIFKRPITLGLDNKDCEFDFDRQIYL